LLKPDGHFAMWWNVFSEPGEDRLFDELARPPSMLSDRHYSLDMLERRIAVTPASLRALFATFSAVRQLPQEQRDARLDAVEAQALRERGGRFERVFRTPLYIARSPG
jgi:hypothetical protein